MSEQAIIPLIGQLGVAGVLALIVWRAFTAHAAKVESFMESMVREMTMSRAEVRTLIEVMSDGSLARRRVRTPAGGVPANFRIVRDTEIDEGGDHG